MAAEVDVQDAVAGLYRLPLDQFVAARDQLAKQLRAAGDREAARRVAGLRRPSVSAWAANQLAHAAPHAMAELLEVGLALQQAQQEALAGQPGAARQLRAAGAQLRAAITRLLQRAETLLTRAGHAASDANLTRLAATLQAAATGDEATRAALAQGRLEGDLDPAGFGLPQSPALSEPSPSAADSPTAARAPTALSDRTVHQRDQARQAAERAVDRSRQAAERARAALEQAQTTAARQQQTTLAAHQHAEDLATTARELADQAAAAASAVDQARQQAAAAERDAEVAAERVRLAQEAADAAEDAQAAAAAALQELEPPVEEDEGG